MDLLLTASGRERQRREPAALLKIHMNTLLSNQEEQSRHFKRQSTHRGSLSLTHKLSLSLF
jgi:hypothetical protein